MNIIVNVIERYRWMKKVINVTQKEKGRVKAMIGKKKKKEHNIVKAF